jgi:fructose/tagatose bisphosphate aldolase
MPKIDHLIQLAHFGDPLEQYNAAREIRQLAEAQGARPASIYPIYKARADGQLESNFTVPAMNLRGLSYLTAQAAFEAAQELDVGLMIFELARSEMKYTNQTPLQLASSVLAAAVKTGWQHPVFIQGDHYQPKAEKPGQIKGGEASLIKELIKDSLEAGIYNIDIDGSTLVDPTQTNEYDQQRPNFLFTAEMYRYVDQLNDADFPLPATVALGCEISEVGTHLSKSSQLAAFMTGLKDEGWDWETQAAPIKVAIETGTRHGGTVNRDGTPGPMHVDFDRIKTMSTLAQHKYGMAGAVQHGASTLEKSFFSQFPLCDTLEIHLSTGFQNTILNHPDFPRELLEAMYTWCEMNSVKDRQPDWSDAQFYAKTRKKAWGPFKEHTWCLPDQVQRSLKKTLKQECEDYFVALKVKNTLGVIATLFP